ncbi:MAG: ThiF family adenylyltransferase, partial [Candidatus Dormiibacterota bacterium]
MSLATQTLDEAAVERYSRQLLLREIGEAGQLRLTNSQVVVVGCGGLGVPAALYLGAAGVGRLLLIDPDQVALDNLNRQVAYRTDEVGQSKATVLAQRIRELNPTVEVGARREAVDSRSL